MHDKPRVWKVGSRWSEFGARGTSIVDIFRRNNYVFVGSNGERFRDSVERNDYLAIADGYTIVAVAKVLDEKPSDLCHLMKDRKLRFRRTLEQTLYKNRDQSFVRLEKAEGKNLPYKQFPDYIIERELNIESIYELPIIS